MGGGQPFHSLRLKAELVRLLSRALMKSVRAVDSAKSQVLLAPLKQRSALQCAHKPPGDVIKMQLLTSRSGAGPESLHS